MYTEILEFFMENGISLNSDQMEELKAVCESKNSGVANRLIKDRAKEKDPRRNFVRFSDRIDGEANGYDASELKENPQNNKREIRNVKHYYGQGYHNMPKDREPGQYLKAQEAIHGKK